MDALTTWFFAMCLKFDLVFLQADCTVLLKLRGGDEYKLVLNMQQYKPENITVKLNDR